MIDPLTGRNRTLPLDHEKREYLGTSFRTLLAGINPHGIHTPAQLKAARMEPIGRDGFGAAIYQHQLSPLHEAATTIGQRISDDARAAMMRMLEANDHDES